MMYIIYISPIANDLHLFDLCILGAAHRPSMIELETPFLISFFHFCLLVTNWERCFTSGPFFRFKGGVEGRPGKKAPPF